MGDPLIEVDLTNDSEDEEFPEMSPRQLPLPFPTPPPRNQSKSKRSNRKTDIQAAVTGSKPQISAVQVERAKYPSDFSQYQNPNRIYSCQWLWGESMYCNIGSDIIPPPPDFSIPSFDFSYFPRSRYSDPEEPRTMITINTNADAINTVQTRAPSMVSVDSVPVSVPPPVQTPNPQFVLLPSGTIQRQRQIHKKITGGNYATMSAKVQVENQQDRNQNQPDSTCTVRVIITASSSSSEHSSSSTVASQERSVNTLISDDLVQSSSTSTTAKQPSRNFTKESVRCGPGSRPLNVISRFAKHGFHLLYDISTDATGKSEDYSCIVGGCTFKSKIYTTIESHLSEKHLKSSVFTEKLALFCVSTHATCNQNGLSKTKFICNFLGCKKEVRTSAEKSRHVSTKHLDKRHYCIVQNCHQKFFYEKQLALHLAAFHRTKDSNGGKNPKPGNASQRFT